MRGALLVGLAVIAGLKLLVWWLEPKMAFFPQRGIQETPAAARSQYTDVQIATVDGETLHGWWLEDPTARAQVIYWHGNGGNLSLFPDVPASHQVPRPLARHSWRGRFSVAGQRTLEPGT